jgi:hypothetical protein
MATTYWVGAGIAIAQVDTLTVTVAANGGTITATVGIAPITQAITYTMTATDTVSTAATALQALLSASTSGMFSEISWTVSGAVITGTAQTPGTPFTLAASSGGGATMTHAVTTANSSPSDANNSANWLRSGAASLPQNTDDVVLQNSSVPILWNVDQLSTVTFNSLTRWQSFTAQVGLPDINVNNYVEYRPRYFKFGVNAVPTVLLGANDAGTGPSLERYDPGANQVAWVIDAAGSASQTYNVYLLGTNAANTLKVTGTTVGLAINPGESGKVTGASVDGGGTFDCGAGATLGGTTIFNNAAGVLNATPATALTVQNGSSVRMLTGGTLTTANVTDGSTLTWNAGGTITTLNLLRSSIFDKSGDLQALTITNSTVETTCTVKDPNSTITWTNATTVNGQVNNGWYQTGPGRTWKVT